MIPKVKIGETDVLAMRVNMISELPGRAKREMVHYIHTYIHIHVCCVCYEGEKRLALLGSKVFLGPKS